MPLPRNSEYVYYIDEPSGETIYTSISGDPDEEASPTETENVTEDESTGKTIPVIEWNADTVVPEGSGTNGTEGTTPSSYPNVPLDPIPQVKYKTITRTGRRPIENFDPDALRALYNNGAKFFVIYTDGTEDEVSWTEVYDPQIVTTSTIAFEASSIGAASDQHFWDDDNGAHVTDDEQDSWMTEYRKTNHGSLANPTDAKPWHNILMNSLGILLRRGLINLVSVSKSAIAFYDGSGSQNENITAFFGRNNAQIGKTTEKHIVLDSNGITAYNGDGTIAPLQASNIAAAEANITNLQADTAKIHNITAEAISAATAYVAALNAANVTANDISADKATIAQLIADSVTVDTLRAASAYIAALTSSSVTANDISANKATINSLVSGDVTAESIRAAAAYIDILTSDNISATTISADHANVATIIADYLKTADMEAEVARVRTLLADYVQTDFSNADVAWIQNGTIKDGAITNAMINSVSANKLTAGTIDASKITVTNLTAEDISVSRINGQTVSGKNLTDALSQHESDISDLDDKIDTQVETLNNRIDGAIETFTGTDVPTLNNTPASSWNTAKLRDQHVGDVYYVVNSNSQQNGYCYRFTKSGSTYSWQLIKDSDVTAALARLQTAEGKIGTIEQFDSDISAWKTDTDEELSSIKSNHTTLAGRVTTAEGTLATKVDTTTFNTLSQTVSGHTSSIQTLTTQQSTLDTRITDTQDSIRKINIGGRNLIRKSADLSDLDVILLRSSVPRKGLIKITPTTSAAYAQIKVDYLPYDEHNSGSYTLSFDVKLSEDSSSYTDSNVIAYIGFNSGAQASVFNSGSDRYAPGEILLMNAITDSWKRISITRSIPDDITTGKASALASGSNLTVQIGAGAQKKSILIRHIKLEKGTKATDWTPAPEDETSFSGQNLLLDTEHLDSQRWEPYEVTSVVGGKSDPNGGSEAYLITPETTTWFFAAGHNGLNYKLSDLGAYYTFSIWLRADNPTTCNICMRKSRCDAPYSSNASRLTIDITTTWRRFYISGILIASVNTNDYSVWIGQVTTEPIYAYHPKLEYGKVPTDWSRAPEDIVSSVTTVSTKLNTVSDTVDGHTQTIGSLSNTLSTKADGSTVETISNNLNNISETVSGHTQSITSLTSTTTTLRTDFDNLEIGGRNLLLWTGSNIVEGDGQFASYLDSENAIGWYRYGANGSISSTEYGVKYTHNNSRRGGITLLFSVENIIVGGEDLTLSCEYRTNVSDWYTPYLLTKPTPNAQHASSMSATVSETEWQKGIWHLNFPSTEGKQTYAFLFAYINVPNSWVEIKKSTLKLERGTKATDWTPAPEDLTSATVFSELQLDYANFKQTVNEFESTVGTTYTTKEETQSLTTRISNAETSINQNTTDIALRATKSEVYQTAQPNLAPISAAPMNSIYNATTNPNGYWKTALSPWYTQLEDGWVHVYMDNSEGTEDANTTTFRPRPCPSVVPGETYTILIEVRNNHSTGSGNTDMYIQQTSKNQFWGSVGGNIQPLTFGEETVIHSRKVADTAHLSGDPVELFRYNARCTAGSVLDFEFRLSLYEGIYDGPYKPYAGPQLFATQAELKIAADGISSEVSKKTDKETIISTINQSAESVKIQASKVEIDGTAVFNSIEDSIDDAIDNKGFITETDANNLVYSNSQPNLTPYFDVPSGTTTYWNGPLYPTYSSELRYGVGSVKNGWLHFKLDNSERTGNAYLNMWIRPQSWVKNSTVYTWLIEVRNLVATGTFNIKPVEYSAATQTSIEAYVAVTSDVTNRNYYIHSATKSDVETNSEYTTFSRGFIHIPKGVSAEGDLRLSVYEGTYSGPYKPYVGVQEQEIISSGRNLLLGTGTPKTITLTAPENSVYYMDHYEESEYGKRLTNNNTTDSLVISFDWETTSETGQAWPQVYDSKIANVTKESGRGIYNFGAIDLSEGLGHYWGVFKLTATQAAYPSQKIRMYVTGNNNGIPITVGSTFTVKNLKLELGSTPTTWSAAPEDDFSEGVDGMTLGGKNLFTVKTSKYGRVNNEGGIYSANNGQYHRYSENIPVEPGATYIISWSHIADEYDLSFLYVAWFTSSDALISRSSVTNIYNVEPSYYKFTAPDDAAYAIVSVPRAFCSLYPCVMFEKSDVPTPFRLSDEDSVTNPNILTGTNRPNVLGGYAEYEGNGWRDGRWVVCSGNASSGDAEIFEISDPPEIEQKYGFRVWASSGNKDVSQQTINDDPMPFKPVDEMPAYAFSCWARLTPDYNQTSAVAQFRIWSSSQGKAYTTEKITLTSTEWVRFTRRFSLTQEQVPLVSMILVGIAGQGSIDYCGLKLEEGYLVTPWVPSYYDTLTTGENAALLNAVKDSANAREQTIYRSAANGTATMAGVTTWVTDSTGNQNVWTNVRPPYNKSYPVLFVATQRQSVSQSLSTTCLCTEPVIDETTTIIDGGRLITNSVTATQIAANTITANEIAANTITAGQIAANTITAGQIAANTITSNEIDVSSIRIGDLNGISDYSTTSAMNTAISNEIKNVEIGGRNLLRNTGKPTTSDLALTRASVDSDGVITLTPTTSSSYATFKGNYLPYSNYKNRTYTFSFEAKLTDNYTGSYTNVNVIGYIGVRAANRYNANLNSSYDRYSTITVTDLTDDTWTLVTLTVSIPDGLTAGKTDALIDANHLTAQIAVSGSRKPVLVKNCKLEVGNKATAWTPAPEDVDADISAAQTTAENSAKTATNYISASSSGIRIASANPSTQKQRLELTNSAAVLYDSGDTQRLKLDSNNGVIVGDPAKGRVLITDSIINFYDTNSKKRAAVGTGGLTVYDASEVNIGNFGATGTTFYVGGKKRSEINSSGLHVYVGDNELETAQFTADGAIIGLSSKSHIEIDYHSLKLIDKDANAYLHVSDLRDSTGQATIQARYDAPINANTSVNFDFTASTTDYTVVITTTQGTQPTITRYTTGIRVGSPGLTDGYIDVEYTTTDSSAVGFTYGSRNSQSSIGGGSSTFGKGLIASGMFSHAEGVNSTTSGYASHAEGLRTTASRNGSHAEGGDTTASGDASHAEGGSTTASGGISHAEGVRTTASGDASHAEGFRTTASGDTSHAEGGYTTASGSYSHASGYNTTAESDYQTVIGKYNAADSDALFIVGNGTNTQEYYRSNAFAVKDDGTITNQFGTIRAIVPDLINRSYNNYTGSVGLPGSNRNYYGFLIECTDSAGNTKWTAIYGPFSSGNEYRFNVTITDVDQDAGLIFRSKTFYYKDRVFSVAKNEDGSGYKYGKATLSHSGTYSWSYSNEVGITKVHGLI